MERFLADAMLGRLATWLRAAGCDIAYFPRIDDTELIRIAREEGRTILTRDTLLAKRRWARDHHLLVEGDHWRDQLRQVCTVFGIDPAAGFLTRCLRCNRELAEADPARVAAEVPSYVRSTCTLFRECPGCRRIYWGGTHRERMAEELRRVLAGDDAVSEGR